MDGRSASGSGSDRLASALAPFGAEAVAIARLVVPLDGSPFAERALPVARWAAGALAADVQVVEVVPARDDEAAEAAIRYLDAVAHRHRATSWDVLRGDDVARALADAVAGAPDRVACIATHGRDRSAALLGSVAAALLHRSRRPVLLAGPHARPVDATDAPVVVAVDGTARDDHLVPVALGWAGRLARPLVIATVAEPAPRPYERAGAERRAHGPADPERYVDELAARAAKAGAEAGVAVEGRVIYDPVSVREGLVPELDRTAALVVLGSRPRQGLPRMVLGSHAARIVHDVAIPALAVPLPAAGESPT
ncbi:MAG TPA: universal stress protein [Acidimicrobiales bacterium]|jgi:nucleotide-binding universal stress UspA family protein